MIGICLPTRGMVFSRVIEELEEVRRKFETKLYISSDLPIPAGHNHLAKEAVNDGCDFILFCEEDTVPLAGTFEKMLAIAENGEIACIDYGVSGWGCVTKNGKGDVLWCGLGCTLIPRTVFEKVEQPWFRTDKVLRQNDWTWQDLPEEYQKKSYGGLDIWFFCQARKAGFKIIQIEGECDHLKLVALGERERNHGLHQIELKERISKNNIVEGGEF